MQSTHVHGSLSRRSSKHIADDVKNVRWIAQAAINVELFTIPLYMTSMYSLSGMHPITGSGNDFYKGRQWPGAKTSVSTDEDPTKPGWGNKRAFNIVFSVFIQEMLHLQLAANIATAIGAKPNFTDAALQDKRHGWTCYGPALTVIPTIVDLRDTDTYTHCKVNVGPLDEERIKLFLAIEQPQEDAEADIVRNRGKYFPKVPFDKPVADIMFGSIGYMYQCYRDYLSITYDDDTKLWDHVFNPSGQQNDLFNNFSYPGHPMREFMGFETTIALTDKGIAFRQALDMMNAITDQGEGSTLKARLKAVDALSVGDAVRHRYRSNLDALRSDYPSYSDTGKQVPSSDAAARYPNDAEDHFARFQEIARIRAGGGLLTWDKAGKSGEWTAADLTTPDYDAASNTYELPTPEQVASALNSLYTDSTREANFATMSQAVVGSIKGVTTVLNQYWNPEGATVSFPFPSMAGSGDRMSSCWAVFGRTPNLAIGIDSPNTKVVNHACQGLDFNSQSGTPGTNNCALTAVYHTCRGSNLCKGMGGCGFVQASTGGGSCGSSGGGCGAAATATPGKPKGGSCSAVKLRVHGGLCGGPTPPPPTTTYTAPSDNICGGFGGCAIPISAMQLYPKAGTMDVYQLSAAHGCGQFPAEKIGTLQFAVGDKVEDIAFQAFTMVAKKMGYPAPTQPAPNSLRLAYPPST